MLGQHRRDGMGFRPDLRERVARRRLLRVAGELPRGDGLLERAIDREERLVVVGDLADVAGLDRNPVCEDVAAALRQRDGGGRRRERDDQAFRRERGEIGGRVGLAESGRARHAHRIRAAVDAHRHQDRELAPPIQ